MTTSLNQPAADPQTVPVGGRGLMSVQVRDRLIAHFRENGTKPGDQILSEPEIVELFKVGRSTAREAVKLLEHEGLVEVRPGLGRFLTSLATATVDRPVTRFESVTELLKSLGYDAQTLVLSVEEHQPDAVEREALQLAEGETVVRLVRLRSEGEEPLIFSIDTISRSRIPGPIKYVDWSGSVSTFLRDQGYPLSFSAARLQAVNMPADLKQRYSLEGHDPWFLITETAVTASGEPVLYAQDYHRGDTFSFNVLRR
ncbi:GntR family transcriptional regulator [Arthrobacter sp. OAP107]|uniref:GntR family transcriptional regulator n=1 Tax=Arthrobacter sp. OAP107 TaxID=3156445 RepID=UPI003391B3AA